MLVDYILNIFSENTVSFEGLVILTLKMINLTSPCCHGLGEGSFRTEVVTSQPHKFLCAVVELLGRGNHV